MTVLIVAVLVGICLTSSPGLDYYVTVGVYTSDECTGDSMMYYVGSASDTCWGGEHNFRFVAEGDTEFTVFSCSDSSCDDCESATYELNACLEVSSFFPVPSGTFMKAEKLTHMNQLSSVLEGKPIELFYFDEDCLLVSYFISHINVCEHVEDKGMYYEKVCDSDGFVTRNFYNASVYEGCNGIPMMVEKNSPSTLQCLIDEHSGQPHKETCHTIHPIVSDHILVVHAFDDGTCDDENVGYFAFVENSCIVNDEHVSMKFVLESGDDVTGYICCDNVCGNCTEFDNMGTIGQCFEVPEAFNAPFSHGKFSKLPYSANLFDELSKLDDVQIGDDWVLEMTYVDNACLYVQSFNAMKPKCEHEDSEEGKAVLKQCLDDQIPLKRVYNATMNPECDADPIYSWYPSSYCLQNDWKKPSIYQRYFCGSKIPNNDDDPNPSKKNYLIAELLESCDDESEKKKETKGLFVAKDGICVKNGDDKSMYFKENEDGKFVAAVCYDKHCKVNCNEYVFGVFGDYVDIPTEFEAPFPKCVPHKVEESDEIDIYDVLSDFKLKMKEDWTIQIHFQDDACEEERFVQAWASQPKCEVKEGESMAYRAICEDGVPKSQSFNITIPGGEECRNDKEEALVNEWKYREGECVMDHNGEEKKKKKNSMKMICPGSLGESGGRVNCVFTFSILITLLFILW